MRTRHLDARSRRTLRRAAAAAVLSGVLAAVAQSPRAALSPRPLFRDMAAESGLNFQHTTAAAGNFYLHEIMGSGAALFDYDSDGDLDVYLVDGSPSGSNRLFRNQLIEGGRLRFTDVTDRAGVGHRGWDMGAAIGDYDNDGRLDLYVTGFGPNVLYHNNGDGTFSDVTGAAGVDDPRWSTSAAFVDYDRDGDLDLFVATYVDFTWKGNKTCNDPGGARDYCSPAHYKPLPARLFRNEGNRRFVDVTATSGIGSAAGAGLGVACADFDGDGWIDIYVANDGTPNHLWLNNRDGTFSERGLTSGTAYSIDGLARAGMGIAAGDFDNDGDEDLFVTNLTREMNTLYLNGGRGLFLDATARFRLGAVSLPFTGFGTGWFDYDNDGLLDLFIANGAVSIVDALRGTPHPYHQKNLCLRNEGTAFRDVSREAGPALELSEVSRGAAFGDIDNDGDVDVVVTNNNGPVRLLVNQAGSVNHWLSLRLKGRGNRSALGATIALLRPDRPPLWRRAHTDGSYLSASDSRVDFGLGTASAADAVVVRWPNGVSEMWRPPGVDRELTLEEGRGTPAPAVGSPK